MKVNVRDFPLRNFDGSMASRFSLTKRFPWELPLFRCICSRLQLQPPFFKPQGRDASQTSKPMDSHMVFNLPALSPFTADSNILEGNSTTEFGSLPHHRFRIFRPKKKSPSCHPKKKKWCRRPAEKKKTIKKSSRRTVSKNFPPGQGTCKWGRLFLLYQCCETWVVVSIKEKWSGWSGHWRIWVFNWEPWQFLEHVWKVSLYVWHSIFNAIPKSDSYLSPVCKCMVLNKLGMNQWIM